MGKSFKKDIQLFIENLKKDIQEFFESEEYINRKKRIIEEYDKKGKRIFKDINQKVKEEGFSLVEIPMGPFRRPDVMPLVDGEPLYIDKIEALVGKGRFPKDEYEDMKKKHAQLKADLDRLFLEMKDMHKKIHENLEQLDRLMFMKIATDMAEPVKKKYNNEKINNFFIDMLEDMADNLEIFTS